MSRPTVTLTGKETFFPKDKIIVSKTDLKGIITYANSLFMETSGYSREELMGQPHNIIRHPDMPRCIFKLLWDTLAREEEIFAYVDNMCKNGDHYWVFAHIVPGYDVTGNHIGYHSSRRSPRRHIVKQIGSFYQQLLEIEKNYSSPKEGMEASYTHFIDFLNSNNVSYPEYIFSLRTDI